MVRKGSRDAARPRQAGVQTACAPELVRFSRRRRWETAGRPPARTVRIRRVVEPGSFLKLVRTVSKNVCVDTYHRERRSATEPLDPERAAGIPAAGDPEDRLRARERLSALAYVLQRLGNSCRELWTLVYGEKLSSGEIAHRLGTTDGNVRVRMHRCLEKARTIAREV